MRTKARVILLTIGASLLLSACATVEPWQRDVMARQSMQLGRNPMLAAAHDHIYFSKEASAGGRGFDGGGCGCN